MQIVVVDTDVVSFLFKNDSRGISYEPHLTGKELVISFMTLAELKFWALQRNCGRAKRRRMDEHLQRFTVFHSDDELCLRWAEVIAIARRNGKPIATADAWIAATALLHKIPLITHNRKHYAGVDSLKIISEAAS
jgi:tRNA(fMet)-specific endonuclease VapC